MLFQDEVVLLRKLPLLADIDPSRLKMLCFASARESFAPGDVIFSEGEQSAGAYVILAGTVDVFKKSSNSHVLKTGSDRAVSVVGQSSMLHEGARRATVTAVTETEALRINSSCFLKLMASCPRSSERIMRALGAQLDDNDAHTIVLEQDSLTH